MTSDLAAKIAQLETLRPVLGDVAVDAAIAALRADPPQLPAASQKMEAGGNIANSTQVVGDANVVLREITVADDGILIVGAASVDLPPKPEAIQRALTSYLETLLERYQFLSLQGMGASKAQQARVALRAVFINLRTNVQVAAFAQRPGASPGGAVAATLPPTPSELDTDARQWLDELCTADERALLETRESVVELSTRERSNDDQERAQQLQRLLVRLAAPRTALEVIRHERAVVLLGDPGSGKTTVLRHLALGFAHARLHANEPDFALDPELAWGGALPLPILVQLRRFAASLAGPPADAGPLLTHIEQVLSGDRLDALARHLVTRLEAGSVLLLLDGLDEVPDDAQRGWVARAAALFQSRFPRSRVVVTCRVYAYRDSALLPHPFRLAELRPLDTASQNDFLARWYRAALLHDATLAANERERVADERARELVQALDRRPRLREIAANPLLLTMIALVHQFRLRLPQQRAELYRECLLLLLEQWEQRRADGAPAGLAAELGVAGQIDHLPLIQPLAYELHVRGAEEASNREAKSWLLERFVDLANDDVPRAKLLIERFLAFLEGRSGLLIARDIKDRYAFPHRTFQEYLVARELIYQGAQPTTKAVLAHRHDAPWREVVLLVAGHLVAAGQPDQARALGWRLMDTDAEGSDGFYRSAVLAGEIIEELGGVLGREGQRLREDVNAALIALVQGGRLNARERVDAALLLGRLGGSYVPAPEQPEYWCDVAAGPFWYGDDRKGPLEQVELPYSFQIARFPVTNAEYARFVEAGGYREQQWWTPNGWQWLSQEKRREPIYWREPNWNAPLQPVAGVAWYEAAAYAQWLDAQQRAAGLLGDQTEVRLPTSLEWERAARHTDKRRYPWGDEKPTPEHANYRETQIGLPSPAGCFSLSKAECGALDMLGNVVEWTATPYHQAALLEAKKDFTMPEGVMLQFSYYHSNLVQMFCGSRVGYDPNFRGYDQGFRLVRSLAARV